MGARRTAAVLAMSGAALWLGQAVVLIARRGQAPDARIEAMTFGTGFVALTVAAGLVAWGATSSRGGAVRAVQVVLAAAAVPLAVLVGQVALFAVPGSHWLESDAVVIVIALVGLFWAATELRSSPDSDRRPG